MAKVANRVSLRIMDTTANGSQIMLSRVFMVEFHIAGRDVKITVPVCSYISLPTIIGITLMR
jgi:hypothetical protein